jgi:hypothetical protein
LTPNTNGTVRGDYTGGDRLFAVRDKVASSVTYKASGLGSFTAFGQGHWTVCHGGDFATGVQWTTEQDHR